MHAEEGLAMGIPCLNFMLDNKASQKFLHQHWPPDLPQQSLWEASATESQQAFPVTSCLLPVVAPACVQAFTDAALLDEE